MITWQETILRLFVAVVLGGLVSIERQRYDWSAGLRPHMLVCLGSALIMIVSAFGFTDMFRHSVLIILVLVKTITLIYLILIYSKLVIRI